MFEKIIQFSLRNKLLVLLGVAALIVIGVMSATRIPLDAVPDITNNQVQIVSTSPTLAPQEVEQLITYPIEAAMTNIPGVAEVRSISRYGLSVITVVFEESVPLMKARQFVQEQLNIARTELPEGLTEPELMPITTGLGEIYQYVLTVDDEHAHLYDATDLRTIQDWIVKRQLNGTPGIIEVSSFGGYLKQYEVSVDPDMLRSYGLTITEVIEALKGNNQNSGGSYIEKGPYSFYIRTEGRAGTIQELKRIFVKNNSGVPVHIEDVAEVRIGSSKRYGAMTMDGKGEVVGGITLMFKGANSSEVLGNVKERMKQVEASLPEGVGIYPYLDRSKLIGRTIETVKKNLIEGGLIVIFVLLLLLGNFRAGLIVASVIPLSMLFALTMMRYFGISANLMSLGAIDFGIVIDGAVIIVESLLHTLSVGYIGKRLSQQQMDEVVRISTSKIYRSAAFGVLIILVVFVPILTLEGTEGKTFRPMAQTVGFAIIGSLILSVTYVPVLSSIFLKKKISETRNFADRIIDLLKSWYKPSLRLSLKMPWLTIGSTLVVFLFSLLLFTRLGAEFVPTLEEGDLAMQQAIKPGSSLQESIRTSTMAERILLDNFPEVEHVVSKIGTAEVPTDPMAIEDADIMVILKEKKHWTSAKTREDLVAKMKEALEPITWASYEFTQPIQLRFNELMTGAKSDISVKLFGEDVTVLKERADAAAAIISGIRGAGDVKVDQTDGLRQLSVRYNRERLAQYGVHVDEVNQVIRAAYAGEQVGDIFEQERKFDLVVRVAPKFRQTLDLEKLTINTFKGEKIPLSELAVIEDLEGPMLISREQARRFINIGVNVRERDVASLVADIRSELAVNLELPPGYEIQYGGQFENLENARKRLLVAVPVALSLILLLLYLAFGTVTDALIIFMAVPLSAVGGILALWLRGMPFSISSGIGFIALFGVSVLNGIVLLSAIRDLNREGFNDLSDLISTACLSRLRPVLMTALVAALGFLPMAVSNGSGAEVQRPLATVVIGGLITSTLLTLILLPTLYFVIFRSKWGIRGSALILLLIVTMVPVRAQEATSVEKLFTYAAVHHPEALILEREADWEQLNKKGLWGWEPLQIQYEGGEINYKGYDHVFSVDQEIGTLFRGKLRSAERALIDSRIETLSNRKDLWRNELRADILTAFNDWSYWEERAQLQDSLLNLYIDLEPVIVRQLEAGAISTLEHAWFQSEKDAVSQQAAQFKSSAQTAEVRLRNTAAYPDSLALIPAELTAWNRPEVDSLGRGDLYVRYYQNRMEELEYASDVVRRESRPIDLSLGYFYQSLEGNFGFQGFQAGVGLPIDRRKSKAEIDQLSIRKDQLELELERENDRVLQLLDATNKNLEALGEALKAGDESAQLHHQLINEKSLKQLESGSIDLMRFTALQERLIDREINRLDLLREYNEHIIRLQYLITLN